MAGKEVAEAIAKAIADAVGLGVHEFAVHWNNGQVYIRGTAEVPKPAPVAKPRYGWIGISDARLAKAMDLEGVGLTIVDVNAKEYGGLEICVCGDCLPVECEVQDYRDAPVLLDDLTNQQPIGLAFASDDSIELVG